MRLTASTKGQVSLEALLLWAGLAAVLAVMLPALANLVDAQRLLFSVHEFDSFSQQVDDAIQLVSFSAPGTVLVIAVPSFSGLSSEIVDGVVYLDYDDSHFSSRKSREIVSSLPVSGSPVFPAREWVFSRLEDGILIESRS